VIGAALGYAMQGMLATVGLTKNDLKVEAAGPAFSWKLWAAGKADAIVISPDIVAMDEARLAALQKFYAEQGIIEKTLPVKDHYTNQFVE